MTQLLLHRRTSLLFSGLLGERKRRFEVAGRTEVVAAWPGESGLHSKVSTFTWTLLPGKQQKEHQEKQQAAQANASRQAVTAADCNAVRVFHPIDIFFLFPYSHALPSSSILVCLRCLLSSHSRSPSHRATTTTTATVTLILAQSRLSQLLNGHTLFPPFPASLSSIQRQCDCRRCSKRIASVRQESQRE